MNTKPYISLNDLHIEINNFLNILINIHSVIFESKDNFTLSLAGLNKVNILKKLKKIESIPSKNITKKINNFSFFLVTLKNDCLNNNVCKRYTPAFLKDNKIQLKIDLLLIDNTLATDIQSILQIEILVEIVGIYLNKNKLKKLESLNKAYLQLKLKLDEEKQAISQTIINENDIILNSNNTTLLQDIKSRLSPVNEDIKSRLSPVNEDIKSSISKHSESNILKNNVVIHTLLTTLKTIKETSDSKVEQIKNNLVDMKDRQVINIKIKKILNEINSIHDWVCVICILLHNIPRIESKIKNGLLSETLGIPTVQKTLKPAYIGIEAIIENIDTLNNNLKKKYTGGVINKELIYILMIVLFNHKKF